MDSFVHAFSTSLVCSISFFLFGIDKKDFICAPYTCIIQYILYPCSCFNCGVPFAVVDDIVVVVVVAIACVSLQMLFFCVQKAAYTQH